MKCLIFTCCIFLPLVSSLVKDEDKIEVMSKTNEVKSINELIRTEESNFTPDKVTPNSINDWKKNDIRRRLRKKGINVLAHPDTDQVVFDPLTGQKVTTTPRPHGIIANLDAKIIKTPINLSIKVPLDNLRDILSSEPPQMDLRPTVPPIEMKATEPKPSTDPLKGRGRLVRMLLRAFLKAVLQELEHINETNKTIKL